ncbi:hypothetical protein LMG22037_02228 [Paraburkholderia phenoliruptrix]|uniref:Uncharacterized protein n=1 Tax=Paraburkholderia phenoliruptrix TaxID=252970 RepID=A0A6J5ASA5_9BURK|nr:hypothetical protein LMG22037_02228 [Paraburkholderia phenoliruptrix]
MATAIPVCRPHASEARRPGSGIRAGGVSRAERGNDGSPSGARRRRRLDAPRARQRDRPCFLAGDAQPSMLDAQAHAPVIGKQVRQRLPWSGRSGAAGSAVFEGRQASRGGDSPQGFPLEASEARSAPGAKVSATSAAEKRCAAPAGTTHRRQRGAISSPPAPPSTATGRSRQAQRTRKPARPRSAR